MKWAMYSVSSLALLAICNQALAADGNINITGNQNSIYIASDNVSGSSFDNLSITSSTATFKKDLIGTQNKNVINQTLSFSGKTAERNIIGLSRVRNGANITQKNTINISGGVIEGDVLATSDEGNYNGTERRSHNLVNISGGTLGGNIEGGAGADNNVITITGGTFKASNNNNNLNNDDGDDGDCGGQGIGTIYAGVSDPNTKNQSNNATVTLKNLNNTNSFITSFVEGNNNQSGIIFGSNITGMSQLQFNNVNATYNGGFKDFDYVDVDVTSQVALNGKSYYADIWKVSGTLNTNGKTIHSYKNSTLNLNVANTGNVTQQFISDANVDAINQGNINGISTNKNIALNNSGNMSGNYSGVTVNITNSGNINNSTGQSTSISSQNPGVLTNTGQINGSLTLNHGMSINNNAGGNIVNAQIKNEQNELNINNSGTIHASEFINQGNKTINITNNSNGVISESLSLTNGTLNLDNNGGTLTDNQFSSNAGVFNINNSGTINGNTSLSASNGGSMSLANQANGLVTGSLEIVSGLSNFENNGLFQDLNITNQQSGLVLNNNGKIKGNGSIKSNNPFSLNNSSAGEISGNHSWQNVALNNSGNVTDLNLTADDGTVTIENQGEISGSNVLNSTNGGSMSLTNQANGLVTGSLEIVSGLSNFENNGLFQDLNITNQQSGLALNNNGKINGNGSIKSNNPFNLNNSSAGEISGNHSWQNVALNNADGATVENLNLTADDGTVTIENQGEISGSNVLNSTNGGSMSLTNQANGLVTGSLEIVSGLSNFENNGLFQDLNITNQQNGLVLNNNGQISNVTFNNNDGNLDIQNSGELSGITNFVGSDDSTITLSNTESGNISGQFVVNGGLASLENLGNISNWQLASNISAFAINNEGTLSGNNELVSEGEITFNNSAEVSGNLFLNSARTIINNNSEDWDNSIIGTADDGDLDFTNASDAISVTTLSGNFNDLSLQNNNTDTTASQFSLDNSANINGQIELGNEGYMDFTNNSNLAADISDNLILADSDTNLETRFDLTNNAQISGDISVMNSALHLTNQTGAEITSNHIDTRELYLTNSGKFENTSDYTFSVQDYINFDNSGVINGGDMVLKLSGDHVNGQITNSGTMWSYGTTIGEENKLRLANNNQDSNELNLYNTGLVIAVDPTDFTIPRLDSYAINAPSMNVYNQNAGVIGGSMNVNNYTQESGTTWVTFMDKDKSVMSTITAQNEVTIEPGAVLFVNTNNDTTAFTDGQQFKLVTALGMDEDEIKTQLDNYILQTDTPFANYSMMNEGNDGYIVFNKVAPSNFASSTDLTTSNHNNIVAGAHRVYELFVNRNMKSSLPNGMSSGDEIEKHTHLAFMPIVGHARQKEDINHSGYRSDYHGGIGYIEHNFTPTIKGGLGLAYLQNNTDYTDEHGSYSNSDTYRPFAYINYTNDNWRVDVAAGTAIHKIRNNRKYSFNDNVYMAKSKYDSDEISAHVSAGYRFHLSDSFMLQPMAGLFAAHVKTDTYEETGNGPMNMHISSEDYTSFKSMLGLKIKKEYKLSESFRLKPEMHLRWYHELGDTNGAVSAYFLAQQELFNANGADAPRDIGDIALRLTTERNDNLDLFVEGFYQFGQDFYNLGGTIGIKYNF